MVTYAAGRDLNIKRSFEWVNGARGNAVETNHFNKDNTILELPAANITSEMRPNLTLSHEDEIFLIARPRFRLTVDHTQRNNDEAKSVSKTSSDGEALWNELYGLWRMSGSLTVAYGLHNFQWGPGEFLSPSNKIFHDNVFDKNAFYEVPGKHLVRVNVSLGKQFSAIIIGETAENKDSGEQSFGFDETFDKKALLKLEYASSSGTSHIGVVQGGGETTKIWSGAYGLYELTDDWALYFDSSLQRGSRALYPINRQIINPNLPNQTVSQTNFERTYIESHRFFTLALGGLRYNLQEGGEIKLEYIFNEAGYSKEEYDDAVQASDVSTPLGIYHLQMFLNPGLELMTKQYAFLSGRFPDLGFGTSKDFTLYLRYLLATEASSQRAFCHLDWDYSDSTSIFTTLIVNIGEDHSELSRIYRGSMMAGAKLNW